MISKASKKALIEIGFDLDKDHRYLMPDSFQQDPKERQGYNINGFESNSLPRQRYIFIPHQHGQAIVADARHEINAQCISNISGDTFL